MGLFGGRGIPEVEPENLENEEAVEVESQTIISEDVVIKGEIHGEGVIKILGKIDGSIENTGITIIEEGGEVRGPIHSEKMLVAGKVEGNIIVTDHLRLESTGEINGDIEVASFEIQNGGKFNGTSKMNKATVDTKSTEGKNKDTVNTEELDEDETLEDETLFEGKES